MCGSKKGAATQITSVESRAVFIHCYGHALNLAIGDTIKSNKILRDTLDTTYEISKLLKYSPRRGALFEKIKAEINPGTPGFRTLCPTQWTVRGSSLESVRINYKVFHELWEEAKDIVKDSETRARIVGVQFYMKSFDYLFGMVLGEHLLKHTDNLSKTLQSPSLTASDGQHIADLTVKTLQKIREEDAFDLFWQNVLLLQESTEVHGPSL